ncbi:MAG TPA: acylphosphatase [Micromonosporaceae bacterium]|jgi:acylphosphatase|nr:acylphosphatase [Micromonosporaceae bacterium]
MRKRVVVTGDVQGVFFRDTCRRVALQRGLSGWVRNMPDGTVEAVFEGAPDGVAAAVAWAGCGPAGANVTGIVDFDEPPEGLRGFDIRPTPWR